MLWLKIIRPQTLFASLCPVIVALVMSMAHNAQCTMHSWMVAICTALCALGLQILSNLINDYYDFVRGLDQKGRVGFKRALAEGLVTVQQIRLACIITLIICIGLGLYLVLQGGWVILGIGLTAILFAWLYTATNHSLSYLGIADIFVFLYYGIIAGFGTMWLQDPVWNPSSLYTRVIAATGVNGLISMCVLITNNLRDIDSDRQAGKRTFPVRFGKRAGELGMLVIVLLMPVLAWIGFRHWLPLFVVFPALALYVKLTRAQGREYNKCLLYAGLINVWYTILVIITVLL